MTRRGVDGVSVAAIFTDQHRDELKKLGLLDAQIAELNAILPLIRVMLDPPSPLTAVRGRLRDIKTSIAKASRQLTRLTNSKEKDAVELRSRLAGAVASIRRWLEKHGVKP